MADTTHRAAEAATHLWSHTTWAGAAITGLGALTLSQWLAVGGFLLAVGGFVVNSIHKTRVRRIMERELALKEMEIKAKIEGQG